MRYLSNIYFQKKPPKVSSPKTHQFFNKSISHLIVGCLLQVFVFQASAQITFIDCECEMQPFIQIEETSGSASNDGTICEGEMATISANGGQTYEWSTGELTNLITVMEGGLYTVTITDNTNCQAIESVLILEHSKPFLNFNPTFCAGTSTMIYVNGAVSYTWENGLMNKPLEVSTGGTYTVTINDVNGCTYVETATIEELPTPTAQINIRDEDGYDLGSNTEICKGENVSLEVTGGYASYSWSPSNGLSSSTSSVTTASPDITTTYSVTVTDNNGCETILSTTIIVNEIITSISPNANICLGESTQLMASGGASYSWSPTAGLSSPSVANPIASPTTNTTYTVFITNDKGCTNTEQVTVGIYQTNMSVGNTTRICLGESTGLSATGGENYIWSPTTGLSDATIPNPTASPTTTTTYTVVITDANGCSEVATQMVEVVAVNVAIQGGSALCLGESTTLSAITSSSLSSPTFTYVWSTSANNETTSNVPVLPSATTDYTVTVTDENGCTAVDAVTVGVNTLQVDAGPNQSVCLGNSVQLGTTVTLNGATVTNGIAYTWSPAVGLSDPTLADPIATPTSTTTYVVSITDANGCTAVDSVIVSVNDLQINAGSDRTICSGDSPQLLSTIILNGNVVSDASITYSWSPNTRIDDTTSPNPIVFPTNSTNYVVTAVHSNGCIAVDTVFVEVNSNPIVFLGIAPQAINYFDTATVIFIQNSPTPIVEYNWSPTRYLDCPNDNTLNCAQPVFRDSLGFDSTFMYSLVVVDENGCTGESNLNINVNINNVAPPIPVMAALSGSIYMENGNRVEESMMHLNGSNKSPIATDESGNYKFEDIPMYENYVLQPVKEAMSYDGVTIADLILINKHILGIELLDSPYKIIAADINRSNSVTIYDVLCLRKALLEKQPSFADNTSWRFIDATYEFQDSNYPLQEDFRETYTIEPLLSEMDQLDFIAVKVGDVNNSATTNSLVSTQGRSFAGALSFTIRPLVNDQNQTITYQFFPNDFEQVEGYQFSIDFDNHQLAFQQLNASRFVSKQHFGWNFLDRGTITTCWNKIDDLQLGEGEPLFSLVFEKKADTDGVALLNLSSSLLQAEAYSTNGERLAVKGDIEKNLSQISYTNLMLFQNEPNPFKEYTRINFYVPKETQLTLSVFDNTGRILLQKEQWFSKGNHNWNINRNELTNGGVLYYQLKSDISVLTKKMLYVK